MFSEFGAVYKYSDLYTYLLTETVSKHNLLAEIPKYTVKRSSDTLSS